MADWDLVTCPYNPAHSIKKSRIQIHLVKCRRSHPDVLKICSFNATHHIPKEEMKRHLEHCPERAIMEARKLEDLMLKKEGGYLSLPKPSSVHLMDCDEDWDLEVAERNMKAYNPSATAIMKQVIRSFPNGTPCQRKQFREEEKKRFQDLKDQQASASVNRPAAASVIRPVIKGPKFKNTEEDESDDERGSQRTTASITVGGSRMVFKYFSGQD